MIWTKQKFMIDISDFPIQNIYGDLTSGYMHPHWPVSSLMSSPSISFFDKSIVYVFSKCIINISIKLKLSACLGGQFKTRHFKVHNFKPHLFKCNFFKQPFFLYKQSNNPCSEKLKIKLYQMDTKTILKQCHIYSPKKRQIKRIETIYKL